MPRTSAGPPSWITTATLFPSSTTWNPSASQWLLTVKRPTLLCPLVTHGGSRVVEAVVIVIVVVAVVAAVVVVMVEVAVPEQELVDGWQVFSSGSMTLG